MVQRKIGLKRLSKEYKSLRINPIDGIEAHPLEENIFEWYYILKPVQEPYKNGIYYGKLVFPDEYPMKAPDIYMITPSGRFEVNSKICLSMSSFHPESWNPSWSIGSMLLGIISFMYEDTTTTGAIESTREEKLLFAKNSLKFNIKIKRFKDLFWNKKTLVFEEMEEMEENENDKKCRYCFDIGGDLVSPCNCKGSNKYVHLDCLKKWQYSTLLSQSTHPKYQTDIDVKCNVCLSKFTMKPPNRYEMMLGFSGKELANMLKIGFLIISSNESSIYNSHIIEKNKSNLKLVSSIEHWTKGVYLITNVIKENNRIQPSDGICAIDLTRPIDIVPEKVFMLDEREMYLRKVWEKYYSDIKDCKLIDLKLFIGGPCNPENCIGLCILDNISEFSIKFKTSTIIPALNVENSRIIVGPIRNIVKLAKFYYKKKKQKIKVHCYFGVAGWSRIQLLGEISRGGWGMCVSDINDIKTNSNNLWQQIYDTGRPMFASKTDYSNNYDISS